MATEQQISKSAGNMLTLISGRTRQLSELLEHHRGGATR